MVLYNVKTEYWCKKCDVCSQFFHTWISDKTLENNNVIINKKCAFCGNKMRLKSMEGRIGYLEGYKRGF